MGVGEKLAKLGESCARADLTHLPEGQQPVVSLVAVEHDSPETQGASDIEASE